MSIHHFGQEAQAAVDKARQKVADFLNCVPGEIFFTSGATESNNWVIKGILKAYHNKIRANSFKIRHHSRVLKPHIITTQIEHHCLLNACKTAEREGLAEITYLPVYKEGVVKLQDLKKAIKKNTILISVMYVNNEIGTVQPIEEIGKLIKKYKILNTKYKILFHTDATQAVNYFDCDVNKLGVDLLSLSGHKIYGPKGVGALYIRQGTPIMQIMDGGEQEFGRRAGTHNVPGIVGLGFAVKQIQDTRYKKIEGLFNKKGTKGNSRSLS